MAPISRRTFFQSSAAAGAIVPVSLLATGCMDGSQAADDIDLDPREADKRHTAMSQNPYEFGAVGDGANDDTMALRKAYEAAVTQGGGTVELTGGRFFIPGGLELEQPGVSLVGGGGAVVGGGEVRIGPSSYAEGGNGVDFSGDRVSGVIFDGDDDYGSARCLVLRNARGLDVSRNLFRSAGKGLAVEGADGNDKFHTTAMLRVSSNRFAKLAFGIYGDTEEWDCLSDWQITDNYFNYCSDTSVWIACRDGDKLGGVDGLNFAGNTVFSQNYNSSTEPQFARKQYNLRLGQTNWLRIINNNFFEAGLSAVYLDTPQNFTFVGNHVAWPGQRELSDALEIHNGSPRGTVEGNTFALWTRAAIGFYDIADLSHVEVGQNAWHWSATPDSWKGSDALPGYRVFVSNSSGGLPIVRDFHETGTFDEIKGRSRLQSRDMKSPKGGVTGSSRRGLQVIEPVTVFNISDVGDGSHFGGLITMTATNSSDESMVATYLLFVSSQGSVCTLIEAGGSTQGEDANYPSFTWALSGNELQAIPVGLTSSSYNFDAVGVGAVLLS
jgi:hypothetical protein